MRMFERAGYTEGELIRLNRVRCHQQVLFYSDIFDCRGRSIDRRYRHKRPQGAKWTSLIFPVKKPPARDFRLWVDALEDIAPRGIPMFRLGTRVAKGHKTWPQGEPTYEDPTEKPTLFWQVLIKWERTWMWDNIQWECDDRWIAEAI
jgi:hypothetical protein